MFEVLKDPPIWTPNDALRDAIVLNRIYLIRIENGVVREIEQDWIEVMQNIRLTLFDNYETLSFIDSSKRDDWADRIGFYIRQGIERIRDLLQDKMELTIDREANILTRKLFQIIPDEAIRKEAEFTLDIGAKDLYKPVPTAFKSSLIDKPAPWDGQRWNERLDYLTQDQHRAVKMALTRSLSEGEGMQKAWSRLRNEAGVGREKAKLIARTEIQRVANEVADEIYKDNQHLLEGEEYLATLDNRTCIICGSDDRRVFYYHGSPNVSEKPYLPRHPRCRCCYAPLVKGYQKLKIDKPFATRRSRAGEVAYNMSYRQWFSRQEAAVQKDILGASRYKLFKQDKIAITKFVDRGKMITLNKLDPTATSFEVLSQAETQGLLRDLEIAKKLKDYNLVKKIRYQLQAGGYKFSKKVS